MASVRSRDGVWWLAVRVGGRQFQRSLKTRDEREARRLKGVVERAALDLARGRLTLPAGVDVVDFLLSDGRLTALPAAPAAPAAPLTLGQLWDAYEAAQLGQREPNTLRTHTGSTGGTCPSSARRRRPRPSRPSSSRPTSPAGCGRAPTAATGCWVSPPTRS